MINKKNAFRLMICGILSAAILFAGCATTSSSKNAEIDSLAQWKGEWQSFDTVTHASQLDDTYRRVAEKKSNYTVEGLKAAVDEMYATPIAKAKFDGTNTVLFTVVSSDGSQKTIPCEYKYVGKLPVEGYDGYFWSAFEAVETVRGLSKARYFIAFPPHQHGKDGLKHWHGRFGGGSIEELVHATAWPTYVSADMDKDELIKEFDKSLAAVTDMFPDSPFETYKGKWVNTALIYEDTRPAVQAVYEKLIAEFAGKNPKGGNFTAEDIIAVMKQTYGTADDFTHLEFFTEDGANDMVIWKDDKAVTRISYMRDKAVKGNLIAFTAKDAAAAGKACLLTFTSPHGNPSHFHLWYGENVDALNALKVKPTCIPADTPVEKVADRVEKSCRKVLQSIVK